MALIEFKNLGKDFGKRQIISIDDLAVESGALLEIVGPNGSGKSTLVRMMASASRPSRGSIVYAREAQGAIGYVPQRGGHYGELTLAENALLISSALSSSGRSLLSETALIESFQLKTVLHQPVRTLSEGMRRVVTFLCVWATRPAVILADEPLAGVDANNSKRLVDLIVANEIGALARVVTSHVQQFPSQVLDLGAKHVDA
jgi:ABC-type multidrug transport system ATPase subunit